MKISFDSLLLIADLFKIVPARTPDRLNVVLDYYKKELQQAGIPSSTKTEIILQLNGEDNLSQQFEPTVENMGRLAEYVVNVGDQGTLKKKYHKILLPQRLFCCNKKLNIVNSFATVNIYTTNGIQNTRSYHGKCNKCKSIYYHGFGIDKSTGTYIFDDCTETILFSTGIGFSTDLLLQADNMITIGCLSFERVASILDANYGFHPKMNPDRLEASWFVFRILGFVKSFLWPRKSTGELNLEELCKNVFNNVKSKVNDTWTSHVCEEPGCKERYVVMDGNCKLFRPLCAAPKTRIVGCNGEGNGYDVCIRNPTRGNQYGQARKYCSYHVDKKEADTEKVLDLRPITRSMTLNIPSTVSNGEGCKRDKKVDRFFETTAGMFYIFRSCGVRLSNFEMYTAESLSDIFKYLVDTFGEYPSPADIRGIAYDRCCELRPFLQRLANEGNEIARRYLNLMFLVDFFHIVNHTEPKCVLDSGECEYHPHLPQFKKVNGMNTEIAEQSFKELNMLKCHTRKMTYAKRILYFKFMDHSHNTRKFVTK